MTPRRFPARRARSGTLVLLLLVIALPHPGRADDADADPAPISWHHDYATALQEARARNQPLWIQFTGPWCPNCTRMERDSFAHAAIRAQAGRDFVAVKLRADLNQELALGFELTGLPATVIVAPSRQVLSVHQGYLAPAELGDLLTAASSKYPGRREPERQLAASEKRPATPHEPTAERRASRPKTETEVALSGYCPVSLVSEKKLVPGQAEYTVNHEGRLYRFANLITFNLFRGDPARYVPVNNGNCPVSQVDRGAPQPGDPKFGVLFQGRLYLCGSGEDRQRFLNEPARYAAVDVAERGHCPHCLAVEGTLVPGDPRIDLKHDGRRYWFPDESHREAFLATVSRSTERR
jgi:YHS domain-containing protein